MKAANFAGVFSIHPASGSVRAQVKEKKIDIKNQNDLLGTTK